MANGINAIFGGFENSYHSVNTRNMVRQYLVAVGVAMLMALVLLGSVVGFVVYEIYVGHIVTDLVTSASNGAVGSGETLGVKLGRFFFFVVIIFFTTAMLYYFGTSEGKQTKFFSPGAVMSTILIIMTTYFFGIYIENFSKYNELYGSKVLY